MSESTGLVFPRTVRSGATESIPHRDRGNDHKHGSHDSREKRECSVRVKNSN